MAGKNVKVIEETDSGRNTKFQRKTGGQILTRVDFVKKIEAGLFPAYYVRKINGIKTPVSKPDDSENNNLG